MAVGKSGVFFLHQCVFRRALGRCRAFRAAGDESEKFAEESKTVLVFENIKRKSDGRKYCFFSPLPFRHAFA